MPINTQVNTNPPDIDIIPSDKGGGGGMTRYLNVHVSWDHRHLKLVSLDGPGHSCSGEAHWHRLRCPPSGGLARLRLMRKSGFTGTTYLIITVSDPTNGDRKTISKPFP
jgi:hypothetical protein